MRDCIFLVADSNMQYSFEGFLSRQQYNQSLQCGEFEFDTRQDLVVAAGDNDPGLYTRGHELLRPYQITHHHAVVVLDAEWDGSPGRDEIVNRLTERIIATGWACGNFIVIVIDPELENWIWQQNLHVARGLGFASVNEMMADPDIQRAWPEEQHKPISPKETLELVLRRRGIPRSSAIYRNITSRVSVGGCQDVAFLSLLRALRAWFPPQVAEEEAR